MSGGSLDLNWTAIGVAVFVFAACVLLDRGARRLRATRLIANRLRRLYSWTPTILGIFTGIGLAAFALERAILAFNLPAPDTLAGTILVAVEFGAAVLLVLGFLSRLAAASIMVLFVAGFIWHPVADVLNLIHFLGIAVFIFAWGRGRLSLGSVFSRLVASAPSHIRPAATLALRITLGLNLIIWAVENVIRTELPTQIVYQIIPGLTLQQHLFYLSLAEAMLGLLMLFGILLRPLAFFLTIILAVGAVFFSSFVFLPYIGIAAALAILGRSGENEYTEDK